MSLRRFRAAGYHPKWGTAVRHRSARTLRPVQEYRVISGCGTDLVWEFRGTPEEFELFQRALTAAEAVIEDDAPEDVSPG